jgi:tetratricopeptide (TPR) repeat protein
VAAAAGGVLSWRVSRPAPQAHAVLGGAETASRGGASPQAEALARALAADAGSADANFVRAYLGSFVDWDYAAAEQGYRRCLDRAALRLGVHRLLNDVLTIRGREGEAMARLLAPLSMMPRSIVLRYCAFSHARHLGDIGEMERIARESLGWAPESFVARVMWAVTLDYQGRFPQAEETFHGILRQDPRYGKAIISLGRLYVHHGKAAEARAAIRLGSGESRWPAHIGVVEASFGNDRKALEWWEKAERERDTNLPYVTADPQFERLRHEPFVARMLQRFRA